MIIDLIKYFAKFPQKEGVMKMFVRGESKMPDYAILQDYIRSLPDNGLLPEIENYVVASSLEKVKGFVNQFYGLQYYLMLDYGEISSSPDTRNSIQDTMRLAVTVACHTDNNADLVEDNIASDSTLILANKLRAHIMADSRKGEIGHGIKDIISGAHQFAPFESAELQSIGWTIVFSLDATDLLNVSELRINYQKL